MFFHVFFPCKPSCDVPCYTQAILPWCGENHLKVMESMSKGAEKQWVSSWIVVWNGSTVFCLLMFCFCFVLFGDVSLHGYSHVQVSRAFVAGCILYFFWVLFPLQEGIVSQCFSLEQTRIPSDSQVSFQGQGRRSRRRRSKSLSRGFVLMLVDTSCT